MPNEIQKQAAEIVAAYVSNNTLPAEELPNLIKKTVEALSGNYSQGPVPPVPIEDSVHDDFLVCLEDGEKVKLLKRYLQKHHDMTPEEYREKWGLPDDYPLVAKSYSRTRSDIAKKQGLGKSK